MALAVSLRLPIEAVRNSLRRSPAGPDPSGGHPACDDNAIAVKVRHERHQHLMTRQ
jgi:hypothetical protein